MYLSSLIIDWLRQGIKTCWYMFKFMIPISIIVKILQDTGLIVYVGDALAPLMRLMGLPGEMGLVWASSMIANIYGGLIAYFQIMSTLEPLTVAQVTTLTTVILIAHTFPIELTVTKRAGAKLLPMFIIRFGFGLAGGMLIYWIYRAFGALQGFPPEIANTLFVAPEKPSLLQWGLNEAKNYFLIFVWVTGLIVVLDVLKRIGAIEKINNWLEPVLRILGIGKEVIPITVVGMTLGLAYGGGLIINSVNQGQLKKRDVLYALVLMALCHSMIEDSLLMMSMGGHYTGVFVFRICFALIVTYLFVKITKNWSEERMQRWFYT